MFLIMLFDESRGLPYSGIWSHVCGLRIGVVCDVSRQHSDFIFKSGISNEGLEFLKRRTTFQLPSHAAP